MQFIYETDRLTLTVFSPDNAKTVYQFYKKNKDFLEPFEPKRPNNFYTVNFHHSNLSYEYNAFLNMTNFRYWLFLKDNPLFPLGCVCFSNVLHGPFQKAMVGYKLDKDCCHKGYMQEALQFLLPIIMKELHLHRIEAYVQPGNQPSIQLLSKLGFVEEGYLQQYAEINGKWTDHLLFSYFATSISQ